ncbi:hypothetical protein GCM10010965_28960 [Caldalkalibacillus thermarum]|uniref:hypothetical protein n=1 Tax=Caldalkalibacillus thermarum TaxID=296745 RepID=UPI0016676D28|nr:hypothetical protein [Caldalkalibacillus thermarum]GGK34230.1 hypothetical protein GCM10010965_28960 [Caldalkalibacillus thermarum]
MRYLRSILLVFLSVCIVFSVIAFDGANVSASQEGVGLHKDLKYIKSVDSYIMYLELESESNQEAREVLNQFLSLSREQQEAFIKVLQPDIYIEVLNEAIEMAEKGVGEFDLNVDDIIIPIKSSYGVALTDPVDGQLTLLSSNEKTVTASEKLYIFNINTTTLYTMIDFNHNGSSATRVLDVRQSHKNWNPGVWVSPQGTNNGYISGGYAFGRGTWKLHATGALGALSSTIHLHVKANNKNRYKKLESTHFNIKGYDWRAF